MWRRVGLRVNSSYADQTERQEVWRYMRMCFRKLGARATQGVVLAISLLSPHSLAPGMPADSVLRLELRTRVEAFKGSDDWQEVQFQTNISPRETAVVICDMWDKHWCSGASRRVDALATKMAPVVDEARKHGVLIIHAPSETMSFYRDYPQRKLMMELAKVDPPAEEEMSAPPLPIDDSDGGCDTPADKFYQAWTREHPALTIAAGDVISDNGREIYSLLQQRGIRTLLIMGVHANMCVLNRSFAIRQMTMWGLRCILVRDLTDTMYSPQDRPYVSHDRGTELVIEYIEKYWCPTVTSDTLMRALHAAE